MLITWILSGKINSLLETFLYIIFRASQLTTLDELMCKYILIVSHVSVLFEYSIVTLLIQVKHHVTALFLIHVFLKSNGAFFV